MSRCHKRISLLTVAVTACGCVMAQSVPLTEAVRDASLPIVRQRAEVCAANPATMAMLDSVSLSEVSAGGAYNSQSRAEKQQLGSGRREITVSARSYTILSPTSTVWGSAGFTTGTTRDIRWTDCIDYLRVAPYVLGDNTGGDLSTREYTFSGGYAYTAGRLTAGAGAAYRAEIAYRDRDPRIKTVVSDLTTGVGAALRISRNYALAANAALGIYRQNCDLDFYNPINDINTYPLTGLGTYYKRFTGNANKNSGYQADTYSAGLQLVAPSGNGLNASAGFSHGRMEQRLRNYNNLTLAYSDINGAELALSYTAALPHTVRIAPDLKLSLTARKGVENLFGSSAGTSYDIIGHRPNYRHEALRGSLSLPVEVSAGTSRFTAIPALAFSSVKAKVKDIDRRLDVSGLTPGVDLHYSTVSLTDILVEVAGGISFTSTSAPASGNNILAQAADISPEGLGQCVAGNFEMLSADRLDTGLNVRVGRCHGGVLYSLSLSYSYRHFSCHAHSDTFAVAFGATF